MANRDESGYVLVVVLVISAMMLSLSSVAILAANTNAAVTGGFSNLIQSRLAAETGLNVATSQVAAVVTSTGAGVDANGNVLTAGGAVLRASLPATITSGSLGSAGYGVALTYLTSAGVAISGAPSTWSALTPAWPASFQLVSTGTMKNANALKMTENVAITAPTATASAGTTTLLPGFAAAIYSPGQVSLSGNVSTSASASNAPANIIAGGGIICPNSVAVQGSIYSYTTSDISFANNCTLTGGLYAASGITLSNNVTIGGDIWSYGADGITLNNSTKIGGNAAATKGSMILYTPSNIVGNATASGTITYNSGSQSSYGTINGVVTPNNGANLASQVMTPEPAFPALIDPTKATWQASEYTNYVSVTSAGESINGGAVNTAQGCSAYFTNQALPVNNYNPSPSQFNLDVNNATTPTVIDAATCSTPNIYGPNGTSTFTLHTDVALEVGGFQTSGTNTFASATSASHNLSIVVPSPQTGGITLNNATTFASTVSVLLYTQGAFSAANSAFVTGQILAGTSVAGSNGFGLAFSSSAALTLPGATTTVAGSLVTTPGTISPVRRYTSR